MDLDETDNIIIDLIYSLVVQVERVLQSTLYCKNILLTLNKVLTKLNIEYDYILQD